MKPRHNPSNPITHQRIVPHRISEGFLAHGRKDSPSAVRTHRHYMALFSNTARAHQMDMTRDWVVLYYDGGRGERQCTVITSQRGALKGQRIVCGREAECVQYYQQQKGPVT